ncbi:MAG: hypothetical protein QW038_02755 [Nanopusillaceae archaeon]
MNIDIGNIEMFKKGKSDVKEKEKRYNIAILSSEEAWRVVQELRNEGINVSKLTKKLLMEFYRNYKNHGQ